MLFSIYLSFFFKKKVKDALCLVPEDVYSAFTFESPQSLHVGISKLVNNCFMSCVVSVTLGIKESGSF